MFQIEQVTKLCSKIALTEPWDPYDIPANSTYEDQYYIGGPGDEVLVQEWSDRKPARKCMCMLLFYFNNNQCLCCTGKNKIICASSQIFIFPQSSLEEVMKMPCAQNIILITICFLGKFHISARLNMFRGLDCVVFGIIQSLAWYSIILCLNLAAHI